MTWSRAIPGAALLVAVGAAVVVSGSAIIAGNPAYLAWLVVFGLLGVALLIWAFAGSRPRSGGVRAVFRWLAVSLAVGLAAVTFWLAPHPADPVPVAAAQTSATGILLQPADPKPTGVAFIPGALVDPRAYQSLFAPIVAAGYPVYIAKPAFGIAFTVPDLIASAQSADPGVEQWVVAGHSLGGAVASDQTDGAAGLILLGSYPINDISDAGVPVLSVSGSNDGLTTPEDVLASRQDLPEDAMFVVIDGGIHAYFGDYSSQRGDGEPGTTRAEAQAQTQQAILEFLNGLPAP